MKKIVFMLMFSISFSANAGLMSIKYFEPIAGCVAGGAIGYATGGSENGVKNAAIYCALIGGVMTLVNYHYDVKYGKEFDSRNAHLDNVERRYDMLEKQNRDKKENDIFRKKKEYIPAKVINGQGIGPRIKESLILNDDGIDLGT